MPITTAAENNFTFIFFQRIVLTFHVNHQPMIDMKGNFKKKNLNGLSPSNICRQRGSEINLHIIVRLKFSSIIYLFVFSDECETATKVRNLRNISRHVEKHFRGKLQQTSLSADINENEWKQEKQKKKQKKHKQHTYADSAV